MAYKIVEFDSGEVAVVFETWLTPNKNNACWPDGITDRLSYVKALRKKQEVDDSWVTYPISRILYATGIFINLLKILLVEVIVA